jgi:hypothetical protein
VCADCLCLGLEGREGVRIGVWAVGLTARSLLLCGFGGWQGCMPCGCVIVHMLYFKYNEKFAPVEYIGHAFTSILA